MTESATDRWPQACARLAGLLYLIVIVGGFFAEVMVRERVTVSGDAAATARNIMANEFLYRLGFAAGVVICACNMPLVLIFYEFFRRVNASLSRLMVYFVILATAVESLNLLNHYAPLVLLPGRPYLAAFSAAQREALGYVALRLQSAGFNISLAMFGFHFFAAGYLMFRSGFLPRILGAMFGVAGLCYLTNSFAWFLRPPLAAQLFPYILAPCLVAELSVCLWLPARTASTLPRNSSSAPHGASVAGTRARYCAHFPSSLTVMWPMTQALMRQSCLFATARRHGRRRG